jgi:hypothetical protein
MVRIRVDELRELRQIRTEYEDLKRRAERDEPEGPGMNDLLHAAARSHGIVDQEVADERDT